MPVEYYIDTEKKVVFETWSENITFEEYVDAKKKLFSDSDFREDFNFITDISRNKQQYDEVLISGIIDFLQENITVKKRVKSAIVADTPKSVAMSFVFEDKGVVLSLNIKIFTTIDAALKWITI